MNTIKNKRRDENKAGREGPAVSVSSLSSLSLALSLGSGTPTSCFIHFHFSSWKMILDKTLKGKGSKNLLAMLMLSPLTPHLASTWSHH